MKPNKKYYAVYKGKQTGVFNTWNEIKPLVQKFKGAKFKSFSLYEQAKKYAETGKDDLFDEIKKEINNFEKIKKNVNSLNFETANPMPDCLDIYVDGACSNNGKKGAIASYGIYVGKDNPDNECDLLPYPPATSPRAELFAIIRCIEKFRSKLYMNNDISKQLNIYTDCGYTIDCVNNFETWRKNNFTTSNGTEVLNLDLVIPLNEYIQKYNNIKLIKVGGHARIYGNEMADRLARSVIKKFKNQ
jgi:ribonuclease HI